MLKYAFIANISGINPKEYNAVYESEDCFNLIIGSPDMEETERIVKELESENFTLMNFCGAYDAEKIKQLNKAINSEVKMSNVKYFPEELKKMNQLKSFKEFGIIIEGTEKLTSINLKSEKCNIYTYFVKDMDMAKEAAQNLVDQGVFFIELCGWFKENMTREIIEAIKGKVPVGSAGIL
ncbi:MAG: DUF6506 family protein [Aminipila sp.]